MKHILAKSGKVTLTVTTEYKVRCGKDYWICGSPKQAWKIFSKAKKDGAIVYPKNGGCGIGTEG